VLSPLAVEIPLLLGAWRLLRSGGSRRVWSLSAALFAFVLVKSFYAVLHTR
jgi:hypothetical protein